MQTLIKCNLLLVLGMVFSVSVFGQTPEMIEKELLAVFGKINENSAYKNNHDSELLEKSNEEFKDKLLKYTKLASTLKYKFIELEKEVSISISTSEDGKFRVYTWDTLGGGTMHFFETVYQYEGANGQVYSKSRELEEGDAGSFVHDLFTYRSRTGRGRS